MISPVQENTLWQYSTEACLIFQGVCEQVPSVFPALWFSSRRRVAALNGAASQNLHENWELSK